MENANFLKITTRQRFKINKKFGGGGEGGDV
jgi:hypothetical protein